jgi:signal peptidase II
MRKANPLQGKWRNVVFFLTALLTVAADQLSKLWIRDYLPEGQSLPETGLFRLTHVHNSGGVFGLFQGQSLRLIIVAFIGVAIILIYALVIYRRPPFSDNMVGKSALGLILGGTIGNLIDRLHLGYVTDFIDVGWWPAFNIADSAVVVGVIVFAYSLRYLVEAEKHRD